MTKKKQGCLITLIVVAILCGVALYFLSQDYIIEITQEDIQQIVDKEFPVARDFLEVFTLTLTDPQVELRNGSERIQFKVKALTNIEHEGEQLKGNATVSAGIQYEPAEGAFYLTGTRVDSLDITLLPKKYLPAIKMASNLAAGALLDDDEPIYTLDLSDNIQALAKHALKDIRIEGGVVKVTFSLAGE